MPNIGLQMFPVTSQFQIQNLSEDRGSVVIDDDDNDNIVHNNEAHSGGFVNGFDDFGRNGMVKKVQEDSHDHRVVKKIFLDGMGRYANDVKVVGIHKTMVSDSALGAWWTSFKMFATAVSKKSDNSSGNVDLAWYGGSIEELCQIISHGFNLCNGTSSNDCQSHGVGIYLTPASFAFDCLASSVVDGSGLSHMLLCRVILGKMEEIPVGSCQFQPSSTEFDSGVDNLQQPRRYIVWNAFMNSHIFPSFIISFKAPSFIGVRRNQVRKFMPTSPWMSFPALLRILSKCLEPSKMATICKYYNDFKKNRIARLQLIQKVREITGDRLLIEIIGRYKNKLAISASGLGSRN